MNNKSKIILCCILIILYITLIFYNNNIKVFKNTKLNETNKIEKILKKLDYGNNDFSFDISHNTLNIKYNVELYNYKTLEKNSSYLFYLVNDLENINYNIYEI